MNSSTLIDYYYRKSGLQQNNTNAVVAQSLQFVIEHYFLEMVPAFVLTFCCRTADTCNFFNTMLVTLFKIWQMAPVQIVNIRSGTKQRVGGRRYYNLIMTDSYESFLEIDIVSYTANYNKNEFYYIFLQQRDHLAQMDIQLILEYCWRNYLLNCNVQIQNANGEVELYTYFPFAAEHCDKVVPVLINRYNGSHWLKPELFPKKLKNFYGCSLRAALWHVPPFLNLKTDERGLSSITGGFEGYMLLTLAKHLNFTIDIRIPPNEEQRGVINGNLTNGALHMLQTRAADFSLGAFRSSISRDRLLSSTQNYYQTRQVYVVLDCDFKPTSFQTFLYPFNTKMWLLLCLTLCSVAIAFKLQSAIEERLPRHTIRTSQLGPQLLRSAFDALEILVGVPTTIRSISTCRRCLLLAFLLFSLVLRTIYAGLLYHLMRSKLRFGVPSTFDELVARNFTVVMIEASNASLSNAPCFCQIKTTILKTNTDTAPFQYLEQHPHEHLCAVGPIDFLLNYGQQFRKMNVFKVLHESVVNFQVTMYFTKHSYLIDHFNDVITWIRAMGLIAAWSRWELDAHYFTHQHNASDNAFAFTDLYAAFLVLLIGLLLALLIFLLELATLHSKMLEKIFKKF